jgi:hypothetical protein
MSTAAAVKERSIIMQPESVRAILEGRKTQTRRVLNPNSLRVRTRHRVTADWASILDPAGALICEAGKTYRGNIARFGAVSAVMSSGKHLGLKPGEFDFLCPYAHGKTVLTVEERTQTWRILPRDSKLYVREPWAPLATARPRGVAYRADWDPSTGPDRWRSPIHMPRWAARLTLEITEVRLEHLWEINDADAVAEGVPGNDLPEGECPGWVHPNGITYCGPITVFREIWDAINGGRGYGWDTNPWVWVITFRRVEEGQ